MCFKLGYFNCTNDIVFNKVGVVHLTLVIHLTIDWIRMWLLVQPVDQWRRMEYECNRMEMVYKISSTQRTGVRNI